MRLVCPRGHSFDIARSGYVNLLQPQDRRSRNPGDSAPAVAARRRLHDRGFTDPLLRAIGEMAALTRPDDVLDAGCGDGYYLCSLARAAECVAHGIDISVPAIESAARRCPEIEWVVANADRFIPYADRCFSAALSITARMNPGEFRRILDDDGRLLVAVPGPDDLVELRGAGRDRVERTVADFAASFRLLEKRRVTIQADLDAAAVEDIRTAIYRPLRPQSAPESVPATRLTFSLDLLLFRCAAASGF